MMMEKWRHITAIISISGGAVLGEARQRGRNRSKSEWTKLINDCYSSGLTIHQWCRENDISHHTFYKVIKRFRNEACDQLDLQPDMLKEHPGTGYHQDGKRLILGRTFQ